MLNLIRHPSFRMELNTDTAVTEAKRWLKREVLELGKCVTASIFLKSAQVDVDVVQR